MPFYHFCFIEEGGRIAEGEDHECADRLAALAHAHSELKNSSYRKVEVWRGGLRIFSLASVGQEARVPMSARAAPATATALGSAEVAAGR